MIHLLESVPLIVSLGALIYGAWYALVGLLPTAQPRCPTCLGWKRLVVIDMNGHQRHIPCTVCRATGRSPM